MSFICVKCQETFESHGLQLVLHEADVGRVCPSCIASAQTLHLVVERVAPNKYELKHVDVQRDDLLSK